MKRILPRGLRAALAVLALAPAAARAQTTYYGAGTAARDAFLAAVAGAQTNALTGYDGETSIDFGALGAATLSGSGVLVHNGSLEGTGGGLTPAWTLSFAGGAGAFGATFSDLGTCCAGTPFVNGTLELAFFSGATSVGAFSQAFASSGPAFFGVAGLGQFDRVEVRANTGDIFYTDDIAVGPGGARSTVPEPGTWALLGSGLLGLVGVARRRQRA